MKDKNLQGPGLKYSNDYIDLLREEADFLFTCKGYDFRDVMKLAQERVDSLFPEFEEHQL